MKNIEIRKIGQDDTQNIIKWRNSPHVMSVFIDRRPLTEEIHNNWLENYVNKGKVVQFVVRECDDEKDIGSVYFRNVDHENSKAELGIFIGEADYIGKGYGTEIIKKAVRYGFEKMGLNRVYARVLDYNRVSYNMFLKLGFKTDAFLREDVIIDGKKESVYIVSMLKEEWNDDE
ncbi:MAG: GNAT family N-acetyltransferase [Erysipelotrichaceae bacterium]|nr:GNAT family N-acetyltransferase [Erysipelotrichaceae bacterium]